MVKNVQSKLIDFWTNKDAHIWSLMMKDHQFHKELMTFNINFNICNIMLTLSIFKQFRVEVVDKLAEFKYKI